MKGVFVRGRRFSAEGLLSMDGMVASTVVEGSMTQALFVEYLEFTVVCRSLLLLGLFLRKQDIDKKHATYHCCCPLVEVVMAQGEMQTICRDITMLRRAIGRSTFPM